MMVDCKRQTGVQELVIEIVGVIEHVCDVSEHTALVAAGEIARLLIEWRESDYAQSSTPSAPGRDHTGFRTRRSLSRG